MRIVAGDLKGRTFVAPAGQDTRPTTDRVREAVFSTLYSELGGWTDVRVLDLYAGSGGFGFEALSRGAATAVGVDNGKTAQRAIEANVSSLGLADRYTLVRRDVVQAVGQLGMAGPFDLIYLDPPYSIPATEVSGILEALAGVGAVAPEAVVGYEHQRRSEVIWPTGFVPLRDKQYGYSAVSYAMYRGVDADCAAGDSSDAPAGCQSSEEGGTL